MADADAATDPSAEPIALAWYVVALAIYVTAGYFVKTWLLNWIIGPFFLLIVLYMVPSGFRRMAHRGHVR